MGCDSSLPEGAFKLARLTLTHRTSQSECALRTANVLKPQFIAPTARRGTKRKRHSDEWIRTGRGRCLASLAKSAKFDVPLCYKSNVAEPPPLAASLLRRDGELKEKDTRMSVFFFW